MRLALTRVTVEVKIGEVGVEIDAAEDAATNKTNAFAGFSMPY